MRDVRETKIGMIIKIAVLIFFSVLCIFTLSGCGNKNTVQMDKDGGKVSYTMKQIQSGKKYGFYVMNRHGAAEPTFTPLLTDVEGTALTSSDSTGQSSDEGTKYFWWCDYSVKDQKINHRKLLPVVSKKHPLVYIQGDSSNMPDSYSLDIYKDLGPTVGAKVGVTDAGDGIFLSPDDCESHSSMYNTLSQMKLDGEEKLSVTAISSGRQMKPVGKTIVNSVDTEVNALLCFSGARGRLFRFKVVHGTQTEYMDVRADTEIFKCLDSVDLGPTLKETDYGYFIVPLPKNIKSGLYYTINGVGVFKYK